MSIVVARKKRTALYLSICGLLMMAAAVAAVSARDPSGVSLRIGMILMTVGAALWLPWQATIAATLAIWLGPNFVDAAIRDNSLFGTNMLLELPGLGGLAGFTVLARQSLRQLEQEQMLIGAGGGGTSMLHLDAETGVYEERLLVPALEAELVRSRRFNREFALVLVGLDSLHQRFDYRDEDAWQESFAATAQVLRSTRVNIDRVYRYGIANFALILPESGTKEVLGMVRRLRRMSRRAKPAEGEPGGPLPAHFGATFFPQCATTTEDLIRRAEIALKVAEKSSSRIQLDGAEAPAMPPPETLRRPEPVLHSVALEERPATETGSLSELMTATTDASEVGAAGTPALHVVTAADVPTEADKIVSLAAVRAEPEPVASMIRDDRPLDDEVADLLKRLDETREMMRALRSGAA